VPELDFFGNAQGSVAGDCALGLGGAKVADGASSLLLQSSGISSFGANENC